MEENNHYTFKTDGALARRLSRSTPCCWYVCVGVLCPCSDALGLAAGVCVCVLAERCNIRALIFAGNSVLRCKGFPVLSVYVCRNIYIEARYTLWRGERYAAKQFLVLPESSELQSICHDAPLVRRLLATRSYLLVSQSMCHDAPLILGSLLSLISPRCSAYTSRPHTLGV
jgi:hypothetical protein